MTTPTKPTISPTVAREADAFELVLKATRVPVALHDGLWDIWVNNPGYAGRLARRLGAQVTTKAAPGMQAIELPIALVQALTKTRAEQGDDLIIALLGGSIATGAQSMSDTDGATRKAKRPGPAGMLDDVSARLQRQPNLNEW